MHSWIKMRGSLYTDPKVTALCGLLRESTDFAEWAGFKASQNVLRSVTNPSLRCVAIGLLLRVWSSARDHGKFDQDDLFLPHLGLHDLGEFAGFCSFGKMLASIGWAELLEEGTGIILPNFRQYNAPMTNAERQAKYRQRHQSSTEKGLTKRNATTVTGSNATVTPREEKRREEVLIPPLCPPKGENATSTLPMEEFLQEWNSVQAFATCRKMTPKRLQALRARSADSDWLEHWKAALQIAAKTPFCIGRNDRRWRATVDWFLRPDTVTKILEGVYASLGKETREEILDRIMAQTTNDKEAP